MGHATLSADTLSLGSRRDRLTDKGRACVDVVESGAQTVGSLSRYLHDVLMMCGSGIWFEQLRQFRPPRSLEESLQALTALELIEIVAVGPARERPSDHERRRSGTRRWLPAGVPPTSNRRLT